MNQDQARQKCLKIPDLVARLILMLIPESLLIVALAVRGKGFLACFQDCTSSKEKENSTSDDSSSDEKKNSWPADAKMRAALGESS